MPIVIAPGGTGSRPTWTSSAKDMVTTALGTSRVWVTLGYGILNEVYWAATGLPQIRDLGFIVAGPSGWFEAKRVNRYQISMPDDWVPLPQVTHQGDCYRLVIEVVPDPRRDVVLISYRLTGDDVKTRMEAGTRTAFPMVAHSGLAFSSTKSVFPSSSPPSSRNKMHCADWVARVP